MRLLVEVIESVNTDVIDGWSHWLTNKLDGIEDHFIGDQKEKKGGGPNLGQKWTQN